MPVMSGPQLADLLRAQQPALKVVFMSGYPGDRLADHGVEPGSAEFLAKPFTTNEVLAKVRAVLAG
jgi:FixJ family two-component response regulator